MNLIYDFDGTAGGALVYVRGALLVQGLAALGVFPVFSAEALAVLLLAPPGLDDQNVLEYVFLSFAVFLAEGFQTAHVYFLYDLAYGHEYLHDDPLYLLCGLAYDHEYPHGGHGYALGDLQLAHI